jgi:hypothetical protein
VSKNGVGGDVGNYHHHGGCKPAFFLSSFPHKTIDDKEDKRDPRQVAVTLPDYYYYKIRYMPDETAHFSSNYVRKFY